MWLPEVKEKYLTKSFESKPEDGIFYEHSEFFSKLKQKAITNEEFQNSKFLFLTLKMKKF